MSLNRARLRNLSTFCKAHFQTILFWTSCLAAKSDSFLKTAVFLEGKNCRKWNCGKLNKNGLDYLQDSEGPASSPLSFYSATGVSTVSSPLNPRLVNGLAACHMSAPGGNTSNLENLASWPNCQQQIQPPPHKQQILSTSTQVLKILNHYNT